MAEIKSHTDLEQSRKLSEILSPEIADMHYHYDNDFDELENIPTITEENDHFELFPKDVMCWSLAALLGVLPNSQGRYTKSLYWFDDAWHCEYIDEDGEGSTGTTADNPIDACYEMILKLHELKLLRL